MKIKIHSPKDMGRIIRAARKSERIRQDDAAGVLGLSDVSLGRIEKGAPGARLENVLRVMNELGIELYAEVPENVGAIAQASAQRDTRTRKVRRRVEPVTP